MKAARSTDELTLIRERILEAALAIITSEGFDSLTMRRLASHTGMTAPNIYNYFANKDEIYIAIVIKGFEMLQKSLRKAYEVEGEPAERARCLMNSYMEFGRQNRAYYDIMFIRATPKYRDYLGTPYEQLSEVEYRISMDIVHFVMEVLRDLMGDASAGREEVVLKSMVRIWSTLHGMISLCNSNIMEYVTPGIDQVYSQVLDDLVNSLAE
ncbi:MAG TPA: TetR/AcrR family transcriptional regulator [Deltaproteobacteria bacterium]|nr:TetR/AcrR family transcriptional regulator [Deltaproteobacteria bacterium]